MQPFWLLLTSIAMLAPPSVPSADAPSGGTTAWQRFAELDPAAQRERLRETLTRLDRANRLALEPFEVVRLRTRYVVLLRRAAQGGTISRDQLQELLRQTNEREKLAIERLARKFRIQVYRTFRQKRGVFTRRRQAWNRVHAFWEAAGGRFEQQDRLIDWLELAIHSSTPDSVGPLPTEPKFEIDPGVSPPMITREPAERHGQPPLPVAAAEPLPPPKPAISLPERGRRIARLPRPRQPNTEAVRPAGSVAPLLTPVPPRKAAFPRPAYRHSASGRPVPARARLPGELPLVAEPLLAKAVPSMEPAPPTAAVPDVVVADRPTGQPRAAPAVRVDLDELAVRIAGANLALRALEAELDEQRQWDAKRLGPLVDQLKSLVTRRNDLTLFRDLISTAQRALVGRLESPRAAISQLAARIFEARNHATDPNFPGTETQRQTELRHLDELSRELAQMASEI